MSRSNLLIKVIRGLLRHLHHGNPKLVPNVLPAKSLASSRATPRTQFAQDVPFETAKGPPVTRTLSGSLSPGPPTIHDEPMDSTRQASLISKCLTRPQVDFILKAWSIFIPMKWECGEPSRDLSVCGSVKATKTRQHQIFIAGDILNAESKRFYLSSRRGRNLGG